MNDKEISNKIKDLSFKVYFYDLDDMSPRAKIRKELCETLRVNRTTLYDKIRNNRFTLLEKDRIAEIVGQPSEILFPEGAIC